MTSHTKHPERVGPVGGGVTARRQAIALGIGGHPWDPSPCSLPPTPEKDHRSTTKSCSKNFVLQRIFKRRNNL